MSKMVLLQEIYCPEQIVIPEQFHLTLKQYAKAVIRTQPFDLLRWSAAYFRCLALSVPPPVKSRYEPAPARGALSAGALRVLIDQLGKGYYVDKKILLEKWEGLCLPEEDLLNVLSLVRMLNWSRLHWLKIVAVFIGLLCKNVPATAEMICEMLTEDPDGGAASVPLWMFRECFLTVADLDCGSVQTFVNGRKVLDEDTGATEEELIQPALPKVLSTISFKNAIIDKYRTMVEQNQDAPLSPASSIDESAQLGPVVSRLESDFKFAGDDADVCEVLRRTPDFSSVLRLLQGLRKGDPGSTVSQTAIGGLTEAQLERARERAKQTEELSETLSEDAYRRLKEQEHLELLKELDPPWLLLYLFARDCCRTKSFNYVEKSTVALADEPDLEYSPESGPDDTLGVAYGGAGQQRRTSSYSMPATVRARMSVCSHSAAVITNEILSKVVCSIDQAIIDGECELSLTSISNFLEQKGTEEEFLAPADLETLQTFLQEAESRDLELKDLNELYNFFVSESFRGGLQAGQQGEPTREIFDIFGESGIEVDANLLEAKISDNMILGLVAPDATEQGDADAVVGTQGEATTQELADSTPVLLAPPADTFADGTLVQEGATQTEPIEIACLRRQKNLNKPSAAAAADESIAHKCKLSPAPGIGPPMDRSVRDAFLEYLSQRAVDQHGLIYPRNFRETSCPKID
ncbi:uncharacterized protein LOC128274360 [Anopheles cruzii]|uniref:uncharacterized protein LOC128274360 n=1 Tax=Anopheles cruzii TaxID=68878 RepID=UPI0022EC678D|nr:uncharacterized protein LOC128274360 [Anopheles cruzii]